MSKFVNGGNAVRLVVLLTLTALSVLWLHVTSAPTSVRRAPSPASTPQAQAVIPGIALAPAATPRPAPPALSRARAARPKPSRAKARHARHLRRVHRLRAARQAARQHRARQHRARSRWATAGGRDIGWPQCPRNVGFRGRNGLGQPMPNPGVRFVIVGLTNGRAFTPNPCLTKHLRWVRAHHVWAAPYVFATYPTRGQRHRYGGHGPFNQHRFLGSLRNAGHAAARYNIRTMRKHGFTSPHVWLDLEPSSSRPWSRRRVWNRAVVQGWVRGYRDGGYTVGFYSTTHLWHDIVGNMRLGVPEWRTAGPVSPSAALRKCHERSFQGGRAVIAQWWTAHRDFDRMCPGHGAGTTMARYFHKW